ncbi:MAG: 23S rRNA (guanosine(2251)-2'-O)-methyltransferase RlmB, partial [Bacteroidales bacterium]|nr:23S rRNA (guanosine(2251)-2'-O)-methyltransferase RlmB [Bacteroidales bacterium]
HGIKGENYRQLFSLTRALNIPFQYVPLNKLNRITQKNHQGVIAFISQVSYQPVDEVISMLYDSGEEPFFVVLDQVTDVRNIGAIARSAECAGSNAIIVPEKGSAMLNAEAVKSSAGSLMNIPVCRVNRLSDTIKELKINGMKVIGVTEKASKSYRDVLYKGPLALVLGSEEKGISGAALNVCDETVAIPLFGKTASLNVSVAAGIVLFEAANCRSKEE